MNKIIHSSKIGKIEYQEKDIIYFSNGLFGFEDYKKFLLVKNDGNNIFFYLQSVDDFSLTFILANPRLFLKEYVLDVHESYVKGMEINSIIDFGIITILEKSEAITINLMGPILIDIKNQIGAQAISLNKNYTTKHPANLKLKSGSTTQKVS